MTSLVTQMKDKNKVNDVSKNMFSVNIQMEEIV